jgi:hypothetical protein
MQRVTQAALIGLTIAIVLTVGSLVWRAVSFDQHMPVLEAVDPAIGHAFYDGINQVLAGTSTDALEAVVSPGFVDHGGDRHGDRSATKLVEELSAFRQSFPNTRVVVNGIESATGTLVASIAPVEPSGALVAGLPLTMKPLAGGYEVLRVQNGRVTERIGRIAGHRAMDHRGGRLPHRRNLQWLDPARSNRIGRRILGQADGPGSKCGDGGIGKCARRYPDGVAIKHCQA